MRRPDTKGNIIRVYVIQRHVHRSETTEGFWNDVDAVLAQCAVTASAVFMERAGYAPISLDICYDDQEPIVEEFMQRHGYRAVPIASTSTTELKFWKRNLRREVGRPC
jgi:hypothetical protein